jgi:hypothetical protein
MAMSGAAFAHDRGTDPGAVDNVDIDYYNDLSADISVDSHTADLTLLIGGALETGWIRVDSKAAAVADSKQVLHQNDVDFREENWINGANGSVDPIFGAGRAQQPHLADRGPVTAQIDVGYFVPVIETIAPLDVHGTGNIGANFAAGYYNQQENVAALATSRFDAGATEEDSPDVHGGWSSASTMALQSLEDNFYGPNDEIVRNEDDDYNDYRDRNRVAGGTVSGSGNIGVNAAAGAFNQQQNMLSVSTASEASLSQASAGVLQNAFWNDTTVVDTNNRVGTIAVSGSGNIGVNAAAGVGNQQHNSLTIAASSGGGSGSNGGSTGGTGGFQS